MTKELIKREMLKCYALLNCTKTTSRGQSETNSRIFLEMCRLQMPLLSRTA
jgi:hypothetical protein